MHARAHTHTLTHLVLFLCLWIHTETSDANLAPLGRYYSLHFLKCIISFSDSKKPGSGLSTVHFLGLIFVYTQFQNCWHIPWERKNIGQWEWNICRESVALGWPLSLLSPAWLRPTCSESCQSVTVCPPSWVFPRPWEVALWISLWFTVLRVLTNSESHSSTTAVSYVTFLAILIHFLSVFYLFQNLIKVGSYSMWLSVSSFCPLPEHP